MPAHDACGTSSGHVTGTEPHQPRQNIVISLSLAKIAHGFQDLIGGNSHHTQVFRPQVVSEEFLFSYGTILVSNTFFMFLLKI